MTITQYSTLQRLIGVVEGGASNMTYDENGTLLDAIDEISDIIDDIAKEEDWYQK